MRIGLFASAAGRKDAGPDIYEHFLVRALAQTDAKNDYHLFCLSQRAADSFQITAENFTVEVLRPQRRIISVPLSLPLQLYRSGVDFYHALFVPPPITCTPLVMTMHGVEIYVHPEFFRRKALWGLRALTASGVAQARMIICVSQHVRDVIAERFRIHPDRLAVVYHGVNPTFRAIDPQQAARAVAEKYGIADPYILFVGKLVAQKNIGRLLEAYARFLADQGPHVKLVICGRTYAGLNSEFDETLSRLQLGNSLIRLGHVNNYDLPELYSAARCFAFPTLYEGFGIPILEAMACGAPVLTSTTSCVPEVAGNAALFVDPYSIDDIAQGLIRLCNDDQLRQDLHERGMARAAQFNWQNTARETLAAYQRAQENR